MPYLLAFLIILPPTRWTSVVQIILAPKRALVNDRLLGKERKGLLVSQRVHIPRPCLGYLQVHWLVELLFLACVLVFDGFDLYLNSAFGEELE